MSGSRSLHRRRNFKDRPGTKRRGAFLGTARRARGGKGDARFSSVSSVSSVQSVQFSSVSWFGEALREPPDFKKFLKRIRPGDQT